jgi:hypothetical protein
MLTDVRVTLSELSITFASLWDMRMGGLTRPKQRDSHSPASVT